MNKPAQFIITPSGERMVVLPEEEYRHLQDRLHATEQQLKEAMEDIEDLQAIIEAIRREQAGEELLTFEEVEEMLEKQGK